MTFINCSQHLLLFSSPVLPTLSLKIKMMKIVLLSAFLGLAAAQFGGRPLRQQNPNEVTILSQQQENNGDGTFRWAYETSDGSRAEQSGYIKNPGAPQDETIQAIQGSYSHYSPEGEQIQVTYTADENGFQPQGAHLPTSPPIPEAIQKSLEIIYRNAGLQQQRAQNLPPRRF